VPPSLALITLWSGPLPSYLRLFLLTAGANPTVDFLFVADSPAPPDLPPNVRWIERPFDDVVVGMEQQLGCPLAVPEPYKLVDFKPAFGVALADLLAGYDFWGHVDCDIVFGDIRSFVTDERLANHDLLTFRGRDFIYGPLTIYRNVEAVNRLYERAPDWQATLSDPAVHSFTETCRRSRIKESPLPPDARLARGERVSMTDAAFDAADRGLIRLYDADHVVETNPKRFPVRVRYERGRLYDESPEWRRYEDNTIVFEPISEPRPVLFFHLLYTKRDPFYFVPVWSELPDRFVITNRGISRGPDGPLSERLALHRFSLQRLAREVPRKVVRKLRRL
jgi:hypothetical protein